MAEHSYPECEKLSAVAPLTQAAGEFIEWLHSEHGIILAKSDGDRLNHSGRSLSALLAEWQSVDMNKVETERRAILAGLRAGTDPDPDPDPRG